MKELTKSNQDENEKDIEVSGKAVTIMIILIAFGVGFGIGYDSNSYNEKESVEKVDWVIQNFEDFIETKAPMFKAAGVNNKTTFEHAFNMYNAPQFHAKGKDLIAQQLRWVCR